MCEGGRHIAAFEAGTSEYPAVPDVVSRSLRRTDDGMWVVWAFKVARLAEGNLFVPLRGYPIYPADAVAECGRGRSHPAPDLDCTCGFHAASEPLEHMFGGALRHLEVALTGRVLVFDWYGNGMLFRAERQTVMVVGETPVPVPYLPPEPPPPPPSEPSGRTARLRPPDPVDRDRVRLRLPVEPPPRIRLRDDAGYCLVDRTAHAGEMAPAEQDSYARRGRVVAALS
ncbi:hypothetical protein [Nocardia huaxiensis]|uniref:Uncharacterized protein n=1 Tax=Nocardia huaxiensis TaxID=2755382 RepID=A0A7D6VNC6_9NOCA|nr:hypothetical protein [Nocardia huaxiensis]QLY33836.1 hypothetical protein H0264_17760 [Nocardia huaxiensis]UFS99237.1 hypothetical protein LPY97_15755 [Nocardia huaxiensis]